MRSREARGRHFGAANVGPLGQQTSRHRELQRAAARSRRMLCWTARSSRPPANTARMITARLGEW